MAYSDLKLEDLETKFQLQYKGTYLFSQIVEVAASERLVADMKDAEQIPMLSEKAKSELMITPILKELWRRNADRLSLLSGFSFNITDELYGICDYILSAEAYAITLKAPVFCVVEAKNRSVEDGYGQCAAEMYAAYLFNQQKNKNLSVVYGCVTTGFDWQFLKLENNIIYIDFQRYSANKKLDELLGILQFIVNTTK